MRLPACPCSISPRWRLPPLLRTLWLSSNRLAGSIPAGWVLPSQLEKLGLGHNVLTGRRVNWGGMVITCYLTSAWRDRWLASQLERTCS